MLDGIFTKESEYTNAIRTTLQARLNVTHMNDLVNHFIYCAPPVNGTIGVDVSTARDGRVSMSDTR
jgi:hypothetical protein